jgi:TRAP-type C4-dicarboxylate transport system substrate-binding protein
VLASEGEQDAVRALGGSPVPMALPEVLAALQQGVLDGVNSAIPVYVAFRYYDTARNVLDTHLWAIVSISMVNKTWYSRLPPELQKAVVDTAAKIEPEVNKWSLARAEPDLKTWTSNGGKILTLSPAEQDEAVHRTNSAVQLLIDKNQPLKEFYEKVKAGAQTVVN